MSNILTTTIVNDSPVVAFPAGANLTGLEGQLVKLSSGTAVASSVVGEQVLGVLVAGNIQGNTVGVQVYARSKVIAKTALAVGAYVSSNGDGTVKAAVTGDWIVGQILETAAIGQRVDFVILHAGYAK